MGKGHIVVTGLKAHCPALDPNGGVANRDPLGLPLGGHHLAQEVAPLLSPPIGHGVTHLPRAHYLHHGLHLLRGNLGHLGGLHGRTHQAIPHRLQPKRGVGIIPIGAPLRVTLWPLGHHQPRPYRLRCHLGGLKPRVAIVGPIIIGGHHDLRLGSLGTGHLGHRHELATIHGAKYAPPRGRMDGEPGGVAFTNGHRGGRALDHMVGARPLGALLIGLDPPLTLPLPPNALEVDHRSRGILEGQDERGALAIGARRCLHALGGKVAKGARSLRRILHHRERPGRGLNSLLGAGCLTDLARRRRRRMVGLDLRRAHL